jgi:chaperonin GroES
MNLKPLHDWAVIRQSLAEDMTEGGLYIPDAAKDKPREGVVEAIGPGAYEEEKERKKKSEKKERRFIPSTVKPGARVLYGQYAGQTYQIDGEERILVRERDILGILPAKPERVKRDLPPLQIPALTSQPGQTAVAKRATTAITPVSPKQVETKPAKKTAKKTAKKVAKKSVKKTTKVTVSPKPKKAAAKKTVSKKTASKKSKKRQQKP